MLHIFFIAYTLMFILLIISAYHHKFNQYYVIPKALCSLGFILTAMIGSVLTGNTDNLSVMLPGLIFYMMGDIFLCFKTSKKFLFTGAGSFFLGHLIIIISIYQYTSLHLVDFIIPFICVIIICALSSLDSIDTGDLKKQILIYAFVLAWITSKAFWLMLNNDFTINSILFFMGYLLFLISDFIIFFILFNSYKNKYLRFLELLTYYYGLFLIAVSIFY